MILLNFPYRKFIYLPCLRPLTSFSYRTAVTQRHKTDLGTSTLSHLCSFKRRVLDHANMLAKLFYSVFLFHTPTNECFTIKGGTKLLIFPILFELSSTIFGQKKMN